MSSVISDLKDDRFAVDGNRKGALEELKVNEKRALLSRICASKHFRRAVKLKAFLHYICEAAFDGRTEELKEHRIGTDVFRRKTGYNMAEDNIVRVEARTLRNRLQKYFDDEGRQEPLIVRVPIGAYVPEFVDRHAAPPSDPEIAASPRLWERRWVLVAVAALAAGIAAFAYQSRADRSPGPAVTGMRAEARQLYDSLLGWPVDRETLVVLSNPRVVVFRRFDDPEPAGEPSLIPAPPELQGRLVGSLNNEPQTGDYYFFQPRPHAYTGMGEAASAYHVGLLMERLGVPTRLTQGRFLDWENAKSQNLIVLGSPHINAWTLANIPTGIFELVRGGIEDRRDQAGQAGFYPTTVDADGNLVRDHGVISLFDLGDSKALILAGRTSAGTYGIGEFFFDENQMRRVFNELTSNGKLLVPSAWQALVRLEIHESLPVKAELLHAEPLSR